MLEKNTIVFVCCADDAARENYIVENYADEVVVPFTEDDYHLCSNILVMNPEYKRMLKDVLRSASGFVVSTAVTDVNILDGLFIKRTLKGSHACRAVVVFPSAEIAPETLAKYRPPFIGCAFDDISYVCPKNASAQYDVCGERYERSEELIREYNDDGMLHLINECVFRTASCPNAGVAAYSIVPYLVSVRSVPISDAIFVQGVIYSLRLMKSRDSETALQRVRDTIGARGYNSFALLKIVYANI